MLHRFSGMPLVYLCSMLCNGIASNSAVHLLTYCELVLAQAYVPVNSPCVQPVPCRLELALTKKCDAQCEDQLQHIISVHLRTRYLASELNEEEVSANLVNYEGSPDHKPAVYLHHSFQRLWTQYNNARSMRSWFSVQTPDLPSPQSASQL